MKGEIAHKSRLVQTRVSGMNPIKRVFQILPEPQFSNQKGATHTTNPILAT